MKKIKQQLEHTLKADKNQQLELPLGVTYLISEDEPVRLLWQVLEEMNFTKHETRSNRGRNAIWSIQELFALWVLGMMNETYSTRKLEQACRNDIRYMWLLGGKPAPDHTVLARFRKKVLPALLEDLFSQQMNYLHTKKETDYDTVFIDGTKLEANANRYSFVWRKSVEKHFVSLKEKASSLLKEISYPEEVSKAALTQAANKLEQAMKDRNIPVAIARVKSSV